MRQSSKSRRSSFFIFLRKPSQESCPSKLPFLGLGLFQGTINGGLNLLRTMYSKQQSPQRLVPLPLVSWRLYQTFTVCMLDFITVPQAPSIKPLFMLHWCMKVK
uniref:Macaca fascicularis brain cDNA clone: QtrA-15482, similar to human hypothetical protein FLJ20580 (FLJ20580), mRNA, RefSeq: NM_017887.1 n=1 Tax=Macaca fascicularis TaxID=9541 RepID=I7GEI0_MACFA|nr:unnamed protein product [Macaca fascicularis]